MRVINRAKTPVAFRDDAGKHILAQYDSVEVKGDQHLVHILSLPGISPTTGSGHQNAKKSAPVEVADPYTGDFTEDADGDPVEYREGDQ